MNARQTFLPKNQKRRPIHHPCSIFLRFLYSAKSAAWSILPRSASCQIAAQPRAVVAPFVPSLVVCSRRAWRGIPSDPQTNLLIDRYSLPYEKRKDRLVKNNFETLFFDKLACILKINTKLVNPSYIVIKIIRYTMRRTSSCFLQLIYYEIIWILPFICIYVYMYIFHRETSLFATSEVLAFLWRR